MFEIIASILIGSIAILVYKEFRIRSKNKMAKKTEYEHALTEMQLMKAFVENPDRIKRWKLIQGKCKYFANAYIDDKNSKDPQISAAAPDELEKRLAERLDEAFAIKDDEYCRAAAFDAIAQFMASVSQFDRARKLMDLITVDIIKQKALEKYKELEVRYPSIS